MKKQILAGLFAALVAVTGCQKDDLSEKVNDLDKRVSALEEKVKELNERTIPGIQATVAALQANIYVTDVTVLRKFSPRENNKKALKPCRKADKKIVRK